MKINNLQNLLEGGLEDKLNLRFKKTFFLLCFIVGGFFVTEQALGAWLPDYSYRKKIDISGSGSEIINDVQKMRVHYGINDGDISNGDIFCDTHCQADFDDVRFTLEDGTTEIDYWRARYGNYEYIKDSNLGVQTFADNSGNLWAINPIASCSGLCKSNDNGDNWILKDANSNALVYVAKNGYVYTLRSNVVYRSTTDGTSPTSVLTLDPSAGITRYASDENSSGHLFFGQYQNANDSTIYRSQDNGATWSKVYENTVAQHIHGIAVDPNTDYIYAGQDGNSANKGILRSTNGGDSFTLIYNNTAADVMGFTFYPDFRLFGGEAMNINSVMKTTDDVAFTPALNRNLYMQLANRGDTVIAGGSTAGVNNRYPQLLRSTDRGENFSTCMMEDFDDGTGFSTGYEFGGGSWGRGFVTPTGASTSQILLGSDNGNGTKTYSDGRWYDGVADRYQGDFYVEIPSIPTEGASIYMYYGNQSADTTSNPSGVFTKDKALTGLISRWKLDDGTGTTVDDSVGNHDGALTIGSGAWAGSELTEYSTGAIPSASLSGDHLILNGDGYITVPDHADFQFQKNFTIIAWVKRDVSTSAMSLISKGSYTGNNGWGLQIQFDSILFGYSNGSVNTAIGSGAFILPDRLTMIGVAVDNATTPNLSWIINGSKSAATALAYTPIAGSGNLSIGALNTGVPGRFVDGEIDDIRIYNGVLSAEEVREIYEQREVTNTDTPIIEAFNLEEGDNISPITVSSPNQGFFSSAQIITLTCNDELAGCDKIYYTTDGTDPTTSSVEYTSPINISSNTTLKFFSTDVAGNNETIQTKTYIINIDTSGPNLTNGTSSKFSTETTSVNLSLTTDENSTCRYSNNSATTFDNATPFTTTGETSHSSELTNLTSGDYTYYAICRDTNNNESSYTLTFEIAPSEAKENISSPIIKTSEGKEKMKSSTIYSDEKEIKLQGEDIKLTNGTIKIYQNSKKIKTIQANEQGKWNGKVKLKSDFSGYLKVKQYNQYGTLISEKKTKVKVDNEKPEFTSFPKNQTLVTRGKTNLTFLAEDNNKVTEYKIYLGGNVYKTKANSFTVSSKTNLGLQYLRIRAYDKAGNSSYRETFVLVK